MANEKTAKTITPEEMRKLHEKATRDLMHSFLKKGNDIWPELKTWDYRTRYAMTDEAWHQKYDITRKFNTYGPEQLFRLAAMKGASREELVRIMMFLLVLVDYVEFQLDEDRARIELGIPMLKKKYMNGGKH